MILGVVKYMPTDEQKNGIGGFDLPQHNAFACKANEDGSLNMSVLKTDGVWEMVNNVQLGTTKGTYQL